MTLERREDNLRAAAKRLGLTARKRVRYRTAGWMIIDTRMNTVVAGNENGLTYTLTLGEAEKFISERSMNDE